MQGLYIKKPEIRDIGDNRVQLYAEIIENDVVRELYYEVDKEYREYLCTERSDAFVVSLLQYAMQNHYNIKWEEPLSERLLYQIETMFMPVMVEQYAARYGYTEIKLNGPITSDRISRKKIGVATGVSGGVDSFYSILKHIDCNYEQYKLTHLIYVALSNHCKDLVSLKNDFYLKLKRIEPISKELQLPIICLFSNESDFEIKDVCEWGTYRLCGMILALQKLISVYYISSGYSYADFSFKEKDCAHAELFHLTVLSNNDVQFLSFGGEVSRQQKVKIIKDNEVVKKYLYVCNFDSEKNCGHCDKCMRTLASLNAYGSLKEYKNIFDINFFEKQKRKYIARMLYRKSSFDMEILDEYKKQRVKIPFRAQLRAFMIRPIYLIWQRIQRNEFAMKIFYKFGLDYKLYGKKLAESIRYSKRI